MHRLYWTRLERGGVHERERQRGTERQIQVIVLLEEVLAVKVERGGEEKEGFLNSWIVFLLNCWTAELLNSNDAGRTSSCVVNEIIVFICSLFLWLQFMHSASGSTALKRFWHTPANMSALEPTSSPQDINVLYNLKFVYIFIIQIWVTSTTMNFSLLLG